MLNILVAIRVWASIWASKILEIFCDNEAVVSVLNMGKTKDKPLATISRNIFMVSSEYDISFKFTHVQGKQNVTEDLLSHWEGTSRQVKKLQSLIPQVTWLHVDEKIIELDYNI